MTFVTIEMCVLLLSLVHQLIMLVVSFVLDCNCYEIQLQES